MNWMALALQPAAAALNFELEATSSQVEPRPGPQISRFDEAHGWAWNGHCRWLDVRDYHR